MGETQLMQYIVTQGVFAVLFCALLLYVLKQNETREKEYQKTIANNQEIISNLSTTISKDVCTMKSDIEDIKEMIK